MIILKLSVITLFMTVSVMAQIDPLDPCAYDCQQDDDGLFANGCCESSYCQCYGGHEFLLHCPEGEIFNQDIQSCDFNWHVPCCNGTSTEVPVTTTSDPSVTTTMGSNGTTTSDPVEYCQSHACVEDGFFSEGDCVPEFCQCLGGTGYLLHCQDGLFYNEITHVCDWPWNNPNCLAPTTIQPPSCSHTCTEENGEFSEGCCENTFCVCFHGEGTLHNCPPGAVFNEAEGFCDEPTTVACCDTTTTTTWAPSTTGTPSNSTGCATVDCTDLMNGPYAEGCCIDDYCVCEDGLGLPHTCVNGTVFDEVVGFCHKPENVACCASVDEEDILTTIVKNIFKKFV